MKKKELTDDQLDKVISLRQRGTSWLKIQHETGINRRTAKRAYEKWQRSKSLEELKGARKDVAVQAFREHMDSLVTLATSLVVNMSVPPSLTDMQRNAEQFFSSLFEADLLWRFISSQTEVDIYTIGDMLPSHVRDPLSYHREKELLFESLKVHTREEIRWDDILDNRWKGARDNCAEIVPELCKEANEVVNDYLKLERETNLLQLVKVESREGDPVKRMVEVTLREIWRAILWHKLHGEGPWFQTVLRGKGTSQEINVNFGDEKVLSFFGDTNRDLAERVTRICNLAYNNLCKGELIRQLQDEVRKMEKANEELREMLNPVKLRPMILRTRCDLCPV